jgi:hypothetical protein
MLNTNQSINPKVVSLFLYSNYYIILDILTFVNWRRWSHQVFSGFTSVLRNCFGGVMLWNNSLRIDMSPYSDTFFWFRANQYLLALSPYCWVHCREATNTNFIGFAFSSWYSWKIAEFALNNNHSLYFSPCQELWIMLRFTLKYFLRINKMKKKNIILSKHFQNPIEKL